MKKKILLVVSHYSNCFSLFWNSGFQHLEGIYPKKQDKSILIQLKGKSLTAILLLFLVPFWFRFRFRFRLVFGSGSIFRDLVLVWFQSIKYYNWYFVWREIIEKIETYKCSSLYCKLLVKVRTVRILFNDQVSISSTFYVWFFCTNAVLAAFFLVTCTLRVRGKSCQNVICTKIARV